MKLDNSEIQLASYHGLRVEVSFPQSSAISNHISNLDVRVTGKIKKKTLLLVIFLDSNFLFSISLFENPNNSEETCSAICAS